MEDRPQKGVPLPRATWPAGLGVAGRRQRRRALWPLAPRPQLVRSTDVRRVVAAHMTKVPSPRARRAIRSSARFHDVVRDSERAAPDVGGSAGKRSERRLGTPRPFAPRSVGAEHHHRVVALAGRVAADLCGVGRPLGVPARPAETPGTVPCGSGSIWTPTRGASSRGEARREDVPWMHGVGARGSIQNGTHSPAMCAPPGRGAPPSGPGRPGPTPQRGGRLPPRPAPITPLVRHAIFHLLADLYSGRAARGSSRGTSPMLA
jgi:hypothetical protein